jgi:hypothetical protein
MITIAQLVEEAVIKSPFLEEGLIRGLVNYSALARQLKPGFEARLYKDIETGSIVMALKRFSKKLSSNKNPQLESVLKKLADFSVRSNIASFTYRNSPSIGAKQQRVMVEAKQIPNNFLTITDGIFETSFFASSNLGSIIEKELEGEHLKSKQTGLSSLTIIIPEEALEIPGVYYSVLKTLAFEGINFMEVVSSFTELTIFLRSGDVERAFGVLKKLNS